MEREKRKLRAEEEDIEIRRQLEIEEALNKISLSPPHTNHVIYDHLNLRTIYRILASQYDPIGFLGPYIARAKVIVQDLWKVSRDWDTTIEDGAIRRRWIKWEEELEDLPLVSLPRCYTPSNTRLLESSRQLHIFCDASERIYGSVAYLRTVDENSTYVSFVMARCRVAPKRQLSMPRLELSAALTGAQLSDLIRKELTIPITATYYWSDSTTVLRWLQSESCRFKVFVGTRVSEIQQLTHDCEWRYINTTLNPADDITRGMSLKDLSIDGRWRDGPAFLKQPCSEWPQETAPEKKEEVAEIRGGVFCGVTQVQTELQPESFSQLDDLIKATRESLDGAAHLTESIAHILWKRVQIECFRDEVTTLKAGKPLPTSSRLTQLDPFYNTTTGLISVGGRLREAELLPEQTKHAIILDPKHSITKLLIKSYDQRLYHPGPERVLAEIRRKFWILRGREAIRGQQRQCAHCQKWRGNPKIPKISDLPQSRLRLFKPAFYSTGVDCFGPMIVKIGRKSEKRWDIIYKCMTTRSIHLDLLESMDVDSFLMSLRRFVARRGKPYEILSDCGTNFKGGDKELKQAFHAMSTELQIQLADQRVCFKFNPPLAPHFGGTWEREIKSVKNALRVALGAQSVTEAVLRTVLIEVEGILNSKPLGYVSSDTRDVNPITPNILLMGRYDPVLLQVIYPETELLGRKRWRHSQVLSDHFWKHFITYYLPGLQTRQKWYKESKNLTVGDVVLIVDKLLLRAQWLVGSVTKVFPGRDSRVRAVDVCVRGTMYRRPVAKLIKLPEEKDEPVIAE
ncbi:uncharacterized protein LOC117114530 [Anneissia japonica]|uniref:uncharacterized protein LOC117114530 n=1 Tax=Anneissia japonica TaxID=1529436 RepID=UPI00142558EE|nr:uncharacterized protein LOC117114530 [Anneissia japonica]